MESGFQVPDVVHAVYKHLYHLSSWESKVNPKICANLIEEDRCPLSNTIIFYISKIKCSLNLLNPLITELRRIS